MRARQAGPAASPLAIDSKQLSHVWLKTSGGATPAIDASYGVSSLTDVAVGLMDVTYQVALGTSEYTAHVIVQGSDAGNEKYYILSQTTAPTATVIRVGLANNAGTAVDPSAGGYHIIVHGI